MADACVDQLQQLSFTDCMVVFDPLCYINDLYDLELHLVRLETNQFDLEESLIMAGTNDFKHFFAEVSLFVIVKIFERELKI